METDEVLALIDGALTDWSVGPDAMRSGAPAGAVDDEVLPQWLLPRPPPSMVLHPNDYAELAEASWADYVYEPDFQLELRVERPASYPRQSASWSSASSGSRLLGPSAMREYVAETFGVPAALLGQPGPRVLEAMPPSAFELGCELRAEYAIYARAGLAVMPPGVPIYVAGV